MVHTPRLSFTAVLGTALVWAAVGPARAIDVQGTVEFEGAVVFAAPIAGIAPEDMMVISSMETEATGNGVQCSILAVSGDSPGVDSSYPDTGAVTAEILMERGGPHQPEGGCTVTLRASGWDLGGVTARGSQTLLIDAATVGANGVVPVPDVVIRESRAVAGVEKACSKWVKKQLKARAKCNFLILKKGPETATAKCKDAGPAPLGCDPGLHVEAALALSHGMNDQQLDSAAGEAVDTSLLGDQVKCQKGFGTVAARYLAKRVSKVQKSCVQKRLDSAECRAEQSQALKSKLDALDKCGVDAMVDGGTGRLVPDAGAPCDVCIDGAGVLDRRCLESCFQAALDELSDGIVGDVPVCGDGVLQGEEFCDDGNDLGGDGCSALCGLEA